MTAAAAPEVSTVYSLTNPPPGAEFEYARVRTDRGATDLGDVPILTWKDDEESIQHMIAFYGPDGVANMINGTSARVSFQGIARRMRVPNDPSKNKSDEEIAKAQIEFRPGKREGGQSTPASRLGNQAKKLASTVNPSALEALFAQLQSKTVNPALLEALGITEEQLFSVPAAADAGEEEEDATQ